jgi:hypothetical protein
MYLAEVSLGSQLERTYCREPLTRASVSLAGCLEAAPGLSPISAFGNPITLAHLRT